AVSRQQQLLRFFHAHPRHKFMRRFAKRFREHSIEVKRRKARLLRRILQRHSLAIAISEVISRAAQPRKRGHVIQTRHSRQRQFHTPRFRSHALRYSTTSAGLRRNLSCCARLTIDLDIAASTQYLSTHIYAPGTGAAFRRIPPNAISLSRI